MEFFGPISTILLANKAAAILAGIINLILWHNITILQVQFGLNTDQMVFLLILALPVAFCFELGLEILLKKFYGFVMRGAKLHENYKAVLYIIMIIVTSFTMIATGLANNEPEKYVMTMFSEPYIIIILIVIAILLKYLEISLRSHIILANKGLPESVQPSGKIIYTMTARKKGSFSAKDVLVTNKVLNATYVFSSLYLFD